MGIRPTGNGQPNRFLVDKMRNMNQDTQAYHDVLPEGERHICERLSREIDQGLPEAESKVWHGHPVWFLDGNPIVGYSKQKAGMRLMFWSGADFEEDGLNIRGTKFKDASVFFTSADQINSSDMQRWLEKAARIQWDYKNVVKRKGVLERLN